LSELQLASAEDSEGFGAALARSVPWAAPRALTLFLTGELGTGKTTLARGLLRALGVEDVVRSPSYTLVESYEAAGHRVLHLDLYRLGGAADLEALGLRDELDEGVLLLVEWPERAPAMLPIPDLQVSLRVAGEGRIARLEARTEVGAGWLSATATGQKRKNL
jgi:tRNA threonylcarbamoyl adenosine modification protein YjeE